MMTISEISGIAASRLAASPGNTPCAAATEDITCTVLPQSLGCCYHRAASRYLIVNEYRVPTFDFTDDVVRLDAVVVTRSAFLNDRQRCIHEMGEIAGAFRTSDIRRYDDRRFQFFLYEIFRQHRHRGQLVDRHFEEALDLTGVEINSQESIGASGPGADRRSTDP